jgi:hypothetical protein
VTSTGRRGWARDLRRVLTDEGDEVERPDFEGDGGGPPWWPARSPCGGGVPALGWRRGAARKVWPAILELMAATACSGGYLVRRDDATELGSYGGGSALQRAARCVGEEAAGWGFMGVEHRRPSRVGSDAEGWRQRDAPGLRRVRVWHAADGSARWACAAGSWPG